MLGRLPLVRSAGTVLSGIFAEVLIDFARPGAGHLELVKITPSASGLELVPRSTRRVPSANAACVVVISVLAVNQQMMLATYLMG